MTFLAPHFIKAKKNAFIRFFQKDHFFVKTPWWIKKLYPGCTWDLVSTEKTLYLSFDDGPHPVITPYILNLLRQYNARASFFCIGDNVQKYPEVYQQILADGHSVGNHTHNHLNGWKTTDKEYLENIKEANKYIESNLFRPPYGRIKGSQIRFLKQELPEMKILMWNILAGDWVQELKPEICFEKIQKHISHGDIIVLHETDKAFDRLKYVLPNLLEYFTAKGCRFERISSN